MKEIKIPLKKFDLTQFVKEMLDFIAKQYKVSSAEDMDPSYMMPTLSKFGPIWRARFNEDSHVKRDILSELLDEKQLLFFIFSFPIDDESHHCADGKEYILPEETINEESDSDFGLGDTDSVGFLVQVKNGVVTLNSGILELEGGLPGPGPIVDIVDDCDVFETHMTKFLDKFMKM